MGGGAVNPRDSRSLRESGRRFESDPMQFSFLVLTKKNKVVGTLDNSMLYDINYVIKHRWGSG